MVNKFVAMAEINVDISKLPDDIRDKLAELELELSEGKLFNFSLYWAQQIDIS